MPGQAANFALGTLSDDATPAGNLANTGGALTANLAASCTALGSYSLTLTIADDKGGTAKAHYRRASRSTPQPGF